MQSFPSPVKLVGVGKEVTMRDGTSECKAIPVRKDWNKTRGTRGVIPGGQCCCTRVSATAEAAKVLKHKPQQSQLTFS